MIHNLRETERFPLVGKAELSAGDSRVYGWLLDVSKEGLAFVITPKNIESVAHKQTWLCRISSADLPAPVTLAVRIQRSRIRGYGVEVGCRIAASSRRNSAMLRAYGALAKARETGTPKAPG